MCLFRRWHSWLFQTWGILFGLISTWLVYIVVIDSNKICSLAIHFIFLLHSEGALTGRLEWLVLIGMPMEIHWILPQTHYGTSLIANWCFFTFLWPINSKESNLLRFQYVLVSVISNAKKSPIKIILEDTTRIHLSQYTKRIYSWANSDYS